MKQQVEVTLTLWVDAELSKYEIGNKIREQFSSTEEVELIRTDNLMEEAEIYGNVPQLYPRKCEVTGEGMYEGFCIGTGDYYIKYEKDMIEHLKTTEYKTLDEAYEDEYYYWTEWETDSNELEKGGIAYDLAGTVYEYNEDKLEWELSKA